jgi:hypothetical protein
MQCENCNSEHDGNYGSGRFCSLKCARAFSTKEKRQEINKKVAEKLNGHPSPLKGMPGKSLTKEQRERYLEGLRRYQLTREKVSEEKKRAANVANVMAYRARKYKATPPDADLKLIKLIYENCPAGYHVDHVQSLSTGGLHHQDNLQYLPISENCRKCADREYDQSKAIDWKLVISSN